ncbi:MAG: excinuclease ABC subunit A, partial [Planctomycetota bacterium]
GPSGSGKTSLVFDTIVREGQHRYLASLSARARQFFGKLGRSNVQSIEGLPPAIAIGASDATQSSRSTVGTLTGVLDLLRLLYARAAQDPGGVPLTRSHFSFNHALGACSECRGSGVEDRVDPELLIADPSKSIAAGALVPTLKNGYTVYSQVTLEVMGQICHAHDFDVQTPWRDLTPEQQEVIFFGSNALQVPFGKHPIESRMRWEGITARPREVGYYRGLIPVIEETLKRNRNPNILRFVRSINCAACQGSRLDRPGREAHLGQQTLPELLAMPSSELALALKALPPSPVLDALRPSLEARLQRMRQLGLGHLALQRESSSLSAGESQRIRLAAQLTAGLGGMLIALDEPTLGLHPSGQAGMSAVLEEMRSLGNTLLVVEHDPDMVRHADHWVALGPGAGPHGGRVTHDEAVPPNPLGKPAGRERAQRSASSKISLLGAKLHNLRDTDLIVHMPALNVVMGPSGAGKSSLVFGSLLSALQHEGRRPQDASYASLEGSLSSRVRAVDARPIGRTSRSTPATWSGLFDIVRKRFAATNSAQAMGLGPGAFSHNNKEGRCQYCEGLGYTRVGLHLLEDLELACAACNGGRYAAHILEVELRGKTVADVLAMSVDEAVDYFEEDAHAHALCHAMQTLGLGYLPLGSPSGRLSRGEAQRVKLATLLGKKAPVGSLLLLDEPDRGLHPTDVSLLTRALDELVDAGHTVLAISHHRQLWAAADYLTEVVDGKATPADLPDPVSRAAKLAKRTAASPPAEIGLRGVRTNRLKNIDVAIPHGKMTVLAGVSGSGKSSLAMDTLAAEAWSRFCESLPFQVRRFVRRMPRPKIESAQGLGPTIALGRGGARAGRRSTVATQSELGPLLRLLWSRAGKSDGEACRLSAEHFSPDRALGACPDCEGLGVVASCHPDKLVTDPALSLAAGALQGTRVGRYLGEADGQFLATLQAAGPTVDWTLPWRELKPVDQRLALKGAGEKRFSVRWQFTRGKRTGEHEFEGTWDGLLALSEQEARRRSGSKNAAKWKTTLVDSPCASCAGERLKPEVAAVTMNSLRLADAMACTIDSLIPTLTPNSPQSASAVLQHLLPELQSRTDDLIRLGLGHLALKRASNSLSDGELQRMRLAGVLRSGLCGLTIVLDEPTAGLHASDIDDLLRQLASFRDEGNTIVVVEHDPKVLLSADYMIELGPGAGDEGGQVIACGAPTDVLKGDGPTASALRQIQSTGSTVQPPSMRSGLLSIRGARANNLCALDVDMPTAGFVAVTGVSGSGKSSLVFDVLEASIQAKKPVECDAIEVDGGLQRFAQLRRAKEMTGSGSVLTAMNAMGALQKLFHANARDTKLTRQAFSFMSPAGRCEACHGTGRERIAMDFMADLNLPCPSCNGQRYRSEVLEVRWKDWNVAEFLGQPISTWAEDIDEGALRKAVDELMRVGLGYLSLGRRTSEMSGGELQRLNLAASLADAPSPSLYLFDEVASGLHEADIASLVTALRRLTERGDLVVAAEHRLSLIAAADWVIDLGPGRGSDGGQVVTAGPPAELNKGATAQALAERRKH